MRLGRRLQKPLLHSAQQSERIGSQDCILDAHPQAVLCFASASATVAHHGTGLWLATGQRREGDGHIHKRLE